MARNRSNSPISLSVPAYSSRSQLKDTSRPGDPSSFDNRDSIPFQFDFTAVPLATQKFDISSTEEQFMEIQEKISHSKNTLTNCKKCSDLLDLLQDLEAITLAFSKNRVRLLNTFFEMYIILQEELKKNKDLYNKNLKLSNEFDTTLELLADRKLANKLKTLKNEVKHKSQIVSELTEKFVSLDKLYNFKSNIEISEALKKEILEKEKAIFNMQQMQKDKFPTATIILPCKDCIKKQTEIESLSAELVKQREMVQNLSMSSKTFIKDCKNPVVKSMLELRELFIHWWENKQDSPSQAWKREGEDLIQGLVYSINLMAESKVEQTGRELRSAVHKKICEVEADFIDLDSQDERVKKLLEKFLELPYLLKPLFDLLKEYEKKELIR